MAAFVFTTYRALLEMYSTFSLAHITLDFLSNHSSSGLGIETLGSVTASVRRILRTLSATKPGNDSMPVHHIKLRIMSTSIKRPRRSFLKHRSDYLNRLQFSTFSVRSLALASYHHNNLTLRLIRDPAKEVMRFWPRRLAHARSDNVLGETEGNGT